MLSAKAREGLALAELQGRRGKQKVCPCAERAGQHSKQPCAVPACLSLRGAGRVGIILAARPPAGDERGVSAVASAVTSAGRQPGRDGRGKGSGPEACCSTPACCSASSSAASQPH